MGKLTKRRCKVDERRTRVPLAANLATSSFHEFKFNFPVAFFPACRFPCASPVASPVLPSGTVAGVEGRQNERKKKRRENSISFHPANTSSPSPAPGKRWRLPLFAISSRDIRMPASQPTEEISKPSRRERRRFSPLLPSPTCEIFLFHCAFYIR